MGSFDERSELLEGHGARHAVHVGERFEPAVGSAPRVLGAYGLSQQVQPKANGLGAFDKGRLHVDDASHEPEPLRPSVLASVVPQVEQVALVRGLANSPTNAEV